MGLSNEQSRYRSRNNVESSFFEELDVLSRWLEATPGIWKAVTKFIEYGMMRINGIKYYFYHLTLVYGPGGAYNEPGPWNWLMMRIR